MSLKIIKKHSPLKPKNLEENLQTIETDQLPDIGELQNELKIKNKKIFELKNKNHEQKILLKFFLNNAENLDDLLAIEKQLRIKDEEIEKINKEFKDNKINNDKSLEKMKINFNEKSGNIEANKEKEKSKNENIINKKNNKIKKLEN